VSDLKSAVFDALELIVQGRIIVSISHDRKCGYLEELDGEQIRDSEFPDRKMLCPGVYTLFKGGYLDRFGVPTAKGRAEVKP
jgi:hypothetical protein